MFAFYIVMMSVMIIFERDKPKNIIIWGILFLFTQLLGYIAYLLTRKIYYNKRHTLIVKQREDDVYKTLVNHKLDKTELIIDDELFLHNSLAFDSVVTKNNNFEIFDYYDKFKENLKKELKTANNYIILELYKINSIDFEDIAELLIDRAEYGVLVKFVYQNRIPLKLKKRLKSAGVRLHRFSKKNDICRVYDNIRDVIIIDGRVAYLGSLNITKGQLNPQADIANAILKIKGDAVQSINLAVHEDVVFASGKYLEYNEYKKEEFSNDSIMQYVSNKYESNIELLIIKAICMAKKSIQMELNSFIPTESIMSLLHFAINSNIDVRLMVPLKTDVVSRFYASRAYAKELALLGANVYLYDGYIRFNAITIDSEYVLYGSFSLDRAHLSTNLQNVCVIKDQKVTQHFNKLFDECINNSYRINDAKFMLVKEKFFKNFV